MLLVSHHRPRTPEHLLQLIEDHHRSKCPSCPVRSKGTLSDFSRNLFEAQFTCTEYINKFSNLHLHHTLEECYRFMYTLFCVAPLQGHRLEEKSKEIMARLFDTWGVRDIEIIDATEHVDFASAVDYIIRRKDRVMGVQVKPQSFFKQNRCVQVTAEKHALFQHRVYYHVYSNSTLQFQTFLPPSLIDYLLLA
jgi:hypothetical protein